MTAHNRRDFFNSILSAITVQEEADIKKNTTNEFENKRLPDTPRSLSGLAPYAGTFNQEQLLHLLRRTLFGVTKADLDFFKGKTLQDSLAIILTQAPTPNPPVNNYTNTTITDPDVPLGSTWINAPYNSGMINNHRESSFQSWWVSQLVNQNRSITEKMTLFWHNHFSTELNTVNDARYCYKHNALLRSSALANFKELTKQVTTDPAMLRYLNGYVNTKNAPDENYGRELQELFTMGKGPDSHYTEDDVKAAAHVLTGWKDDKGLITSSFNINTHDTSDKKFSGFYNNTIIKGRSDAGAGAAELDDLMNMIFAQQEVSKFICRKLYRWFVYYVIDAQTETNVITPLAQIFRNNNYEILPVLNALLASEHFFDSVNYACQIKNPIDHIVGACRNFNVVFPAATTLDLQYGAWEILKFAMAATQMAPGEPPNVAGWPAYYQEPQYYELWINSDTLPKRNLFTDKLTSQNGWVVNKNGGKYNLLIDPIAFTNTLTNPNDPNTLIAETLQLVIAVSLTANQVNYLKSILLSNQAADHYWTDAWLDYKNNPNDQGKTTIVLNRLRSLYTYIMDLAEYQLC